MKIQIFDIIKMAKFKIIILVFLTKCLMDKVVSKCSFTQDCEDKDDPKCAPYKVDKEPEILDYDDITCQEYKNKPVCCNKAQDKILSKFVIKLFKNKLKGVISNK